MNNSDKIILDLCGVTGSWSAPYKAAGYVVLLITLPYYDVRTYEPPKGVYGDNLNIDHNKRAARRSIFPPAFCQAFFEANQ